MAYWIQSIITSKKGKMSITIPKLWAKRALKATDRFLFLKETNTGQLLVMTEEEYFAEKNRKHKPDTDQRATGSTET
jgi:hypothetical protein